MRGLLLAAAHSGNLDIADYWRMFESEERPLYGLRYTIYSSAEEPRSWKRHDWVPIPSGTDVDPLAIEIVKHELELPDSTAVSAASSRSYSPSLKRNSQPFPQRSNVWIHSTILAAPSRKCPNCSVVSPNYIVT